MAVTKERAQAIQKELAKLLEKHGPKYDWASVRERYPDVPRATFYRWIKKLNDSGLPSQNALRKAKRRATAASNKKGGDQAHSDTAAQVVEHLPVTPDSEEFCTVGLDEIVKRLRDCMTNAQRLIDHAQTDEGKIRNPRLLLQSSEHLRRSIETTAKLMGLLWDIQRTERLHTMIFERLKARDPELVQAILQDLKTLNLEWGVKV